MCTKEMGGILKFHCPYESLPSSSPILLTFTLLSFFGVLAMLLKLEAGRGLKLFLHYK